MEEYNFLEETYAPIVEQEKLFNSKGYQNLKKNNIDTAELDGIEKEPEAGKIEFKELSKEDNQIFFKDVTDFVFKDLPKDTIISLIKGGTNATQFLNNLVYATGITPADDNIMFNKKLDKVKSQLDNLQEDSPLVSKLMAIVAQDAAFTYPIYKKLKNAGVPKGWSLPIAFGLGGALAFGASLINKIKGFEKGGRPPVGQPSIVGEKGAELFVPDQAGTIVPNDKLGMSKNVTVNFNISTVDARGFNELLVNSRGTIVNLINSAVNEKGKMAIIWVEHYQKLILQL